MTWVRTGVAVATLPESRPQELVVGARTLVLVRSSDRLQALDGICPHLGGLLAEGTVEGDRLACPLHGAVFSVSSGAVVADPFGLEPPEGGVDPLRTFPTRVEAGMVEVDLPDEAPPTA
ncbi:MAG: Rieske (2Fe-2S) protein [Thermoplasmata archaeon]|nr:Rieske (2Fe-2S) protein [Thermoplasmata archaeon]